MHPLALAQTALAAGVNLASAGGLLGYQLVFFLIHGVAVALTLRFRPKGRSRAPAILLNVAFNLTTAYLFFLSMNAFVPFYVSRSR